MVIEFFYEPFTFNYTLLVPAIPPETLSQLQESCDKNDALDYFQSVNVEIPQLIHEISENKSEVFEESVDYGEDDLDEIPDMEDFDNQNLLVSNDPVSLILTIVCSCKHFAGFKY